MGRRARPYPLRVPGANTPSGEEVKTVRKIRRSLGAFTVAAVIAAGLVLTPSHALATTSTGYTSTTSNSLIAFCLSLDAQIGYIESLSLDGSIKAALLAPLESTRNTFCYNVAR